MDALRPVWRYVFSWGIVAAAGLLVWAWQDRMLDYAPLIFMMAVYLSALAGGLAPGLLSIVVSLGVADFLIFNPGVPIPRMEEVADHLAFAGVGVVVVWLVARRKRVEQELRTLNETLEQRVIERTEELEQSYEKLRQSERLAAIGQMITGLSHESRNALQRIYACLQMLEKRCRDDERARDLLKEALRAQNDLNRVYEDVQAYAAQMRLDRQTRSVADVWREAWEDLSGQRHERDATLVEQTDGVCLECNVDAFRLKRVFRNLFENSLAACSDPTVITVVCNEAVVGDGPGLRIRLQDNGPGLEEEHADRIFEPFYTTKAKGTGLGMSIAKRLVEGHGGAIAIDSRPGEGLEVIIDLPRQ